MDYLLPLLGIFGTIVIGAMSPGPSFVMVARTAIAGSRGAGLAAALGMGLGGASFAALALVGLIALLMQVGWLYAGLKLAGGLYLLYLAVMIWRGARQPLRMSEDAAPAQGGGGLRRAFLLGLMTQLSNPKTAVVYAGIFAALMPETPPLWLALVLPAGVFVIECGWYAVVAIAFSAARPRAAYLSAKHWIDRLAGGVMGLLGLRMLYETAQP
jgi:threonine/homoserine/homoserine lactone efflux protein